MDDTDWFLRAPCGLIALSPDDVILHANDTFLTWTGYERGDLTGRPFGSLLDVGSRLLMETRVAQLLHLQGRADEVAVSLVKADGTAIPALINAVRDERAGLIRVAVFNATERVRYERELLAARRAAEASERRVRILQELSTAFGLSATDEDVARSFADAARDAFDASHTAVHLADDSGELVVVAGSNPLFGKVRPVPALRATTEVTVVTDDSVEFPEIAAGLREIGSAALTVTPLIADGERVGLLVCYFAKSSDFDAGFWELQHALGRQASQTLVRLRLQRKLAALALHDQLTGLANRQLLQLTLDQAIEASTLSGEPLSVLFLDIDDFKSINDAFGHSAGDSVLIELATRLAGAVRAGDTVGRIGGDEFVAILVGADKYAAESVAERILAVCRAPVAVSEGVVSASVSVGVAVCRRGMDRDLTSQQLLVRADAAMYDAKRAGKDRVTLSPQA
ncbi:diguanylate cyclase [Microbacterium sp. 4R-513]|nr:diguanylate cyclase [Microbacterium sp. 4R-513]